MADNNIFTGFQLIYFYINLMANYIVFTYKKIQYKIFIPKRKVLMVNLRKF